MDLDQKRLSLGDRLIVDRVEFGGLVHFRNAYADRLGGGYSDGIGHANRDFEVAGTLGLGRRPGECSGIDVDYRTGGRPFLERELQRQIGIDGIDSEDQHRPLGHLLVVDKCHLRCRVDHYQVVRVIGRIAGRIDGANGDRMRSQLRADGRPGDGSRLRIDRHAVGVRGQEIDDTAGRFVVGLGVVQVRPVNIRPCDRIGGEHRSDGVDGNFQRQRNLADQIDCIVKVAHIDGLVSQDGLGRNRMGTLGQWKDAVRGDRHRGLGGDGLSDRLPLGKQRDFRAGSHAVDLERQRPLWRVVQTGEQVVVADARVGLRQQHDPGRPARLDEDRHSLRIKFGTARRANGQLYRMHTDKAVHRSENGGAGRRRDRKRQIGLVQLNNTRVLHRIALDIDGRDDEVDRRVDGRLDRSERIEVWRRVVVEPQVGLDRYMERLHDRPAEAVA